MVIEYNSCLNYHEAYADCLTAHLDSLKKYSPGTEVVLLGDVSVMNAIPGCVSSAPYSARMQELDTTFKNYSTNPSHFEQACIQRWFIMYEYAKIHGIREFWSFDRDVLIFSDLKTEAENMAHVSMTLPMAVFFCRDIELLNPWLEWILELYRYPENITNLIPKMAERGMDNVSDMQLAFWYWRYSGKNVLNLLGHISEYGAWDSNLSVAEHGFALENDSKVLRFTNGYPEAWNARRQEWIRMLSLHCWGNHKKRMREYLDACVIKA